MLLTLWLLVGALAVVAGALYAADRFVAWPHFVVVGVLGALGIVDALNGIVGAFTVGDELTAAEIWIGRLATLILLGTVAFALARPRFRAGGRLLCYTGVAYISLPVAVGLLQGVYPLELVQTPALTVAALVAVWAAPRVSADVIVLVAKVALGITIVGSFVVLALGAPDIWLEGETSIIPGVPLRFQGATYHPNVLGPVPVLYLLLERYRPSPRWVRIPLSLLGIAALVLTQSKTAAAAGVIAAVAILALDHNRSRNERITAGMFAALLFVAFTVYVGLGNDVVTPETADRFRSLSGRTRLWLIGLREWLAQPITGAGPEFFETWARTNNQLWAGQAHNQFVQTLAEQGLVGMVTLVAYTGAMMDAALRAARRTGAISVALLLVLLIRFLTETPMTGLGLEHWILYCLLIAWEREEVAERAGEAGRSRRGADGAGDPAPALVGAGTGHSGP